MQCVDGVQGGGLFGGEVAEEDADAHGDAEGQGHCAHGGGHRLAGLDLVPHLHVHRPHLTGGGGGHVQVGLVLQLAAVAALGLLKGNLRLLQGSFPYLKILMQKPPSHLHFLTTTRRHQRISKANRRPPGPLFVYIQNLCPARHGSDTISTGAAYGNVPAYRRGIVWSETNRIPRPVKIASQHPATPVADSTRSNLHVDYYLNNKTGVK